MPQAIPAPPHATPPHHPLWIALALSLGSAIALGIARFSYALLLTPMRDDLGWTYIVAGGMNTGNALGYLIGALLTPWLLRRQGVHRVLLAGAIFSALFMLGSGLTASTTTLLILRILAGAASALLFIAGGLLATRMAMLQPQRAGFLIGLFYGGTGFGIIASSLLVPWSLTYAEHIAAPHRWQLAWLLMGLLGLLATALMMLAARRIPALPPHDKSASRAPLRRFTCGLAAYFLFGVGYIGYMTFVIALLREDGMSATTVTLFYALLGVAVIAATRLWARMLDKFRGGEAMAILCALLALATALPALTASTPLIFASGILFGGVFLSVVASTTAMVRHNLPHTHWAAGISAFTIVFAAGQIVGPTIVGWIADHGGGLRNGLLFSALVLLTGALLAWRQRPLAQH
ncbi:YbfB/YjiJ family MFS transporter [Herbaspirillum sp. RTI4]|uniref:YbfB/YjiJ family MFS transporter n=1 Tax=Herbaspirillum sp. RTI4 TaxID=3048640 RepID=UPI002AB513ED|nr:YbfB/YjiJ family MFS transporter [Herbaspirillum sp. RTI4]MDY7577415.1 YbfB/YjiJ family MFS transporter [Herbaspirillum sp. RTI4]MEA9981691.1 YbfB/YjiJ family MFS transporter [Herbaspirillum sp. RTI4]